MASKEPLVSVLTPAYNAEPFLRECIESVLSQKYHNYEYIIVNNCSTDATLEIASNYANRDNRIKVVSNDHFVGVIENYNIAFKNISPQSKYCKVVSADDWIYPECITKLVEVAERHYSVGIVGAYANKADGVRWLGIPHDTSVFNGRKICRLYLLGEIDFFGTPSAVLYRSDLVRSEHQFFPGSAPNADVAACLNILRANDFGFVHQILSFERIHENSVSSKLVRFNSFLVDRLDFLVRYGQIFLSPREIKKRLKEMLKAYYSHLAIGIVNLWDKEYWRYHKNRLKDIGLKLDYSWLAAATFCKLLDLLLNPKLTIEKMVNRAKGSLNKIL